MQAYNTYVPGEAPATRILFATLDLGEAMLASGGEVHRVEDTISRILRAYGAERVEVFTITTSIIVTVQSKEWGTLTQTRRISGQKFNLTRLCALNQLSRRVCKNPLPPDAFDAALAECAHTPSTSAALMPLAWALVSASFSIFFGGNLLDGLISAVVGIILCHAQTALNRIQLNSYISVILLSILGGLLARFPLQLGASVHPAAICIGNIMLLIPGISLTNSMRDLFSGDTIAGLLRFAESIILSLAIGWGFALSAAGANTASAPALPALISAFTGSVGFGYVFHFGGKNNFIGALGSTIAYGVVLLSVALGLNEFLGYFLAAIMLGLWSEIFARVRQCPATVFMVIGFISLVPGGSLYRTMRYGLARDWPMFGLQGMHTGLYAIAISAGVVLITAITEVVYKNLITKKA